MARITVEDCLDHVENRFALVLITAERTKQLMKGSTPRIEDARENKEIVTALREIAAGLVRYHQKAVEDVDPAVEAEVRRASQIREYPEIKLPEREAARGATLAPEDDAGLNDEIDDDALDDDFDEDEEHEDEESEEREDEDHEDEFSDDDTDDGDDEDDAFDDAYENGPGGDDDL